MRMNSDKLAAKGYAIDIGLQLATLKFALPTF